MSRVGIYSNVVLQNEEGMGEPHETGVRHTQATYSLSSCIVREGTTIPRDHCPRIPHILWVTLRAHDV